MQIRKNTKAYKTILEILTACRDRPDREQLIRVYITKAGDTIKDRISVEGIQDQAGLFYEMGYQAVLGNLKSSNHQLHHSDEIPGIYFFHSSSNKVWDETPFEFDETIKKEFGSLPELPVLRKKGKAEKFVFPAAKVKKESQPSPKEEAPPKKEKTENKKGSTQRKKEKVDVRKAEAPVVNSGPKQPEYNLKHEIHFSGLDRIVIRQPQLSKRDVLDYYNKIAESLLPYLEDRPQVIRLYRDGKAVSSSTNLATLRESSAEEIPDWIQTATVKKGKAEEELLLCNDKEHLLFYVQMGCLDFHPCHWRITRKGSASAAKNSLDSPDYIVIGIESPDYELTKAIDVALVANDILSKLQLPSFVKTDGASGLHIYLPLDSKSTFDVSKQTAEYLCKLVRLKIPDLVSLKGTEANAYKKVSLDYLTNEPGKSVIAPYSLAGQSANVATPLSWSALPALRQAQGPAIKDAVAELADVNHETISKRLKENGDPFETLFKKKVNADALLERLEENYSFLF
jgi:bifunctional non-homologous end joining protein LigD